MSGLQKVFPPAGRGGEPTVALEDVELTVPRGALVSVLGPSGSGKTTLVRCIAGFERPDAGVIGLGGRELVSPATFVPVHARGIGIVPQEGALFPHLTVAQNIGFGLAGQPRATRRARVAQLLDLVGLHGLGERRPDQLSGGQQQRVALARALAPEPELILLDEPFSALDAQLRVELREEVRALLDDVGATALLVTHDQSEAMSLADHLVVMRAGRVVAAGDPRSVYEQPADVEFARFLGDAVVVPGEIVHGLDGIQVECPLGRLAVCRWHGGDGACLVLIRPEHIAVGSPGDPPHSRAVLGTVVATSFFGHDALLKLGLEGVSQPVPVRVWGNAAYRPGDTASLAVTQPVCTYPLNGSTGSPVR
ncbi:MAG: ABC transporter ATP-binding protein [Gaiellales bacterium]